MNGRISVRNEGRWYYLVEWLEVSGLKDEPKAPLFPAIRRGSGSVPGKVVGAPTRDPMYQSDAYDRIRKHAVGAALAGRFGNHSMRGTGVTAYLKNGGTLEKARAMANHSSTPRTQLYGRRSDDAKLDEVERVWI